MNKELQTAADKLIQEIFAVKPGETVTITTDYDSNMNLTRAVADAVERAGGHPMILQCPTPRSVGKAADPDLPIDAMMRALRSINYEGYVSLEWLKRYGPDLSDPGIVFPHYANFMNQYQETPVESRKLISNHYKKKQQQKEEFNRANSRAYDGPAEKLEIQPPAPPAEHLEIQEPAREEDDAPPPEDGR